MELKHVEFLGSGGFGNVDLVADESGKQHARKTFSVNQVMPKELVDNVRKRFVREAKPQSGVKHRNVVPITHTEISGEYPWYLMPVAETSLDKEIASDSSLSGQFKLAISDIVSGLEELHAMQMYHRDLKPQNVLKFKSENDGKFFYAISDFGFVALNDSKLSNLTYTGMKKGADYYTAPEIAKDLRNASGQTDIYSLGCIIHDMVGIEDRVPCGEIREQSPFGALLLNCTRQKTNRRFKSVSVVRDVLLSIDADALPVQSVQAIDLAHALSGENPLTKVELSALAEFLEDNFGSEDAVALLRKLSIDKIDGGWITDANAMKRIGLKFGEWISQRSAFDFDFCDVLASRAAAFLISGDFDLQAELIMALLTLGTSHNRWYVERRFMELCDASMDEALAKRVAVEIRAGGSPVCADVEHLELSISRSREQLHPIIVHALQEACP